MRQIPESDDWEHLWLELGGRAAYCMVEGYIWHTLPYPGATVKYLVLPWWD